MKPPLERLPCKGSWRQGRLRGHCCFVSGGSSKTRQNPALHSLGTPPASSRGAWKVRTLRFRTSASCRTDAGAGDVRRSGRILARSGAAPLRLRLWRIHLPLQGRHLKPPLERLPCKGSWRQGRLRGALPLCIRGTFQKTAESCPASPRDAPASSRGAWAARTLRFRTRVSCRTNAGAGDV